MNQPLLPKGICRDDTQHGKLYFTLEQIRAYGQECAQYALTEVDKSRMKHNTSGQAVPGFSDAFDKFFKGLRS